MSDFIVQQGWQCPICKRVYSPLTFMCYFCGGETVTSTGTGTFSDNDWKKKQDTGTPYTPQDEGITTTNNPNETHSCHTCKHDKELAYINGKFASTEACKNCFHNSNWERKE